jgi:hypothetical protein
MGGGDSIGGGVEEREIDFESGLGSIGVGGITIEDGGELIVEVSSCGSVGGGGSKDSLIKGSTDFGMIGVAK